jgi:hypothetical protein
LRSLLGDAVEHGSRAVERVQLGLAARPFSVLEKIEPIAVPARGVHEIHDAAVTGTHTMIRLVARVVGETIDVVLDAAEKPAEPRG